MDRNRILRRRANVFAGACVLFLGLTLVRGATETEVVTGKALPATFVGVDVDKVRAVQIEGTTQRDGKPHKQTVRLERSGVATWVVASADKYPADAKKVEDFVKKLADVRTKAENTSNPDKFAAFAGPDGFTEVRLFGEGDEPIVSFGIGKGNAEGSYGNTFLRIDDVGKKAVRPGLPGDAPAARIVAATDVDAWGKTETTSWIETRLWPALVESDVASIEWKHAAKSIDARLERTTTPAEPPPAGMEGETKPSGEAWTLQRPAPGGKAKDDAAKQMVQAFVGLQIAGVEGRTGPGADEKYGFDKPEVVALVTGKPPKDRQPKPTYQVEIGKKIEGKSTWYARRSLLTGPDVWIFAVNDYELGRFRDDPVDLLEKKPEPPPAPPADAAMGEPAMGETPPTPAEPAMGETPPAPAMTDAPPTPSMAETPPTPGTSSPPAPPAEPSKPSEPAMGETPPPPAMTDAPPSR
jgi:hypothetical protein